MLFRSQTPRHVSRIARVFAWIFVIGPLLTLWIPWQQNIMGTGYVSAYAPLERRQLVESPVGGRIKRWHVQEGAKVRAGDLLVELTDVDQSYAARLAEQRAASASNRSSAPGPSPFFGFSFFSMSLVRTPKLPRRPGAWPPGAPRGTPPPRAGT